VDLGHLQIAVVEGLDRRVQVAHDHLLGDSALYPARSGDRPDARRLPRADGRSEPLAPSLEALVSLHRAHRASIPFQNLDVNYSAARTRANDAVASLNTLGQPAARCSPSGTVHVIVDVNGYFE
jgi:hypothetical protein